MEYLKQGIELISYDNKFKYELAKNGHDVIVENEAFAFNRAEGNDNIVIISHGLLQQILPEGTLITMTILYFPTEYEVKVIQLNAYCVYEVISTYQRNMKTGPFYIKNQYREYDQSKFRIIPIIGVDRSLLPKATIPTFKHIPTGYKSSKYFLIYKMSNVLNQEIIDILTQHDGHYVIIPRHHLWKRCRLCQAVGTGTSGDVEHEDDVKNETQDGNLVINTQTTDTTEHETQDVSTVGEDN